MNTRLTSNRSADASSAICRSAWSRRRVGRAPLLAAIFWLMALAPQPSPAQFPPDPESSARFLFLVDTSAATRRRAPAMLKAVSNLMLSSMSAELRRGDSVGVWTFNEELYTGRFPLQHWTPEATKLIASNVVTFLKAQPYEKSSRFEVVQSALEQLVKGSEKLTVLLVSDGNGNLSGTPFDQKIRGVFQREFQKQRNARMPFITVLRSRRGQFVNATVNLAPWPVEFPPFPPAPKTAAPPRPAELEPAPAALPPLVIIGKPPAPPETTNSAAPLAAAGVAVTNTPPPVESKPEPAPSTIAPAVETTKETPAATAETPPPATTPKPEPPKPSPTPVAELKTELPPLVLATPPAVASNAEAGSLSPEISAPTTNAPGAVALAVPPEPASSRLGLLVIGLAVLLLAGGLLLVMQRRSRAAAQASLITRSMDHDRK